MCPAMPNWKYVGGEGEMGFGTQEQKVVCGEFFRSSNA